MRPNSWWPAAFLAPASVAIGFFFATLSVMLRYSLSPLASPGVVGDGFTLANYATIFGSPFYLSYLWRSLWISTYCTAITAVLGYTYAYAMYRYGRTMRLVAGTVLVVQFFTAYVIRTYAVMLVIGRTGILNRSLIEAGVTDQPLALLFTEAGVAIGMVMVSLPFMVLPVLASLHNVPTNLETAAASLGAGPVRVFWEVVFPLTIPGLAAGTVIVFLFELTSYIVPGILGGGYVDMIANLVYSKAMRSFDLPSAAAVSTIMLIVALAAIYVLQKTFAALTPRSAPRP